MDPSGFPLDSYNFFLIILTGFVIVWSFRKTMGQKEKISDFEYLGLSAFWGTVTLVCLVLIQRGNSTKLANLDIMLKEPRISGPFIALWGGFCAVAIGLLLRYTPAPLDKIWHHTGTYFKRKFRK